MNGSGRCIRPDYASSQFSALAVAAADTDTTSLLSAINATDTMNTQLLDNLQDFAKTGNSTYPIKPIRANNGEEYYMLVLLRRPPFPCGAMSAGKNAPLPP